MVTPRSVASRLGLRFLPMSHKNDARLIRVKERKHRNLFLCTDLSSLLSLIYFFVSVFVFCSYHVIILHSNTGKTISGGLLHKKLSSSLT